MKKYNCPECGETINPSKYEPRYVCSQCQTPYNTRVIEKIEALKQQIIDMRNCQNCQPSYHEAEIEYCMELDFNLMGTECINNGYKHWKP